MFQKMFSVIPLSIYEHNTLISGNQFKIIMRRTLEGETCYFRTQYFIQLCSNFQYELCTHSGNGKLTQPLTHPTEVLDSQSNTATVVNTSMYFQTSLN